MSSQIGSYYYTARAGEQLEISSPVSTKEVFEQNGFAASDYVSTVSQTAVLGTKENDAVRSSALAAFSLNHSSSVSDYNTMMRQSKIASV